MSTDMIWETVTTSSEATSELGRLVGSRLHGGEVIELVSDLGGGKTTFVRGLAKGVGSSDAVRSPSFTIGNQYQAGDKTLYHFDFYRLQEAGILEEELLDILNDPQAITVIEWADIVEGVLPERRVTINLRSTGENERKVTAAYPKELGYIFVRLGAAA